MKWVLACALGFSIFVSPALAVTKIKEVSEAGINGCKTAPSDFGPKFWDYVNRTCKGKHSCNVNLTKAYSKSVLTRYGCTGYFVEYSCDLANYDTATSPSITRQIKVQCK